MLRLCPQNSAGFDKRVLELAGIQYCCALSGLHSLRSSSNTCARCARSSRFSGALCTAARKAAIKDSFESLLLATNAYVFSINLASGRQRISPPNKAA
jgi:hypothetical protein